jgi:hypothetical protein
MNDEEHQDPKCLADCRSISEEPRKRGNAVCTMANGEVMNGLSFLSTPHMNGKHRIAEKRIGVLRTKRSDDEPNDGSANVM